jgi:hypothetical protein
VDHGYDGVALLAGLPADGSAVERRAGSPALSITGSEDRLAALSDVTRGFEGFRAPRLLAVVQGMNHFDWTDGASDADRARDGAATRPQAQTRRDALRVLDTFIDAAATRSTAAIAALESSDFPGVTERR